MAEHPDYPRTRLFVESVLHPSEPVILHDDQAHYLKDVLRLRPQDRVALFNGRDGEWLGTVRVLERKNAVLDVVSSLRPQASVPDAWCVCAPLKQAKHESVIEKATELGVRAVQLVYTRYTVVDRINASRLSRLMQEASEQSERMDVPELLPDAKLEQVLSRWDPARTLYYGDESGGGENPALLSTKPVAWAVLIGPEGGFAHTELSMLRALPFTQPLSLGPRILKADTAAIAALGCLMSRFGDWHHKPAFRNPA